MNFQRCLLAIVSISALTASALAAGPREAKWKEVEQAMEQGLPQTAIEKLGPIIEQSLGDKAYAEAIKAISQKIALEGTIEGGRPAECVTRMLAQIETVPAEMRPVMEAILANWYWYYFQQNRWQFMQRTQTATSPSEDFTTWDLARILAEVDKRFQQALKSADVLKQTPIAEYDALLQKGTAPDAYRPTLYDFLAHNAIEFYSAGEQAGSKAEDAFVMTADSPIFSSIDDFLAWGPVATDNRSSTLTAIGLFQALIRFHQPDPDKSALLDADLLRLNFGNNFAAGEEKATRYKVALQRFADQHSEHPISTRALADLATALHSENAFAEAHKVADVGLSRFTDSVGAHRCYNLIKQIEARSAAVTTERVWNKPLPTINVRYRNLTKVYFKIVPLDFEAFARSNRGNPEQLDDRQMKVLVNQKPIASWTADLPATTDFQERVERIAPPGDLKPGSYYLVASHNERFSENDNQLSVTEIWVSDLALVIRPRDDGVVEGLVFNAITGEPQTGAKVRGWPLDQRRQRVPLPPTTTDKNGLFQFNAVDRQSFLIHAEFRGHSLSSNPNYGNLRAAHLPVQDERTIFFTDRSLYRPGQTIHFKGICLKIDQERDQYETIPGRRVNVVFIDVNGKEIERVSHRSNAYGSFSGSVTAPRDRLMGQMVLRVDGEPNGEASIDVEEYKRPKFQVSLDAPTEAARLGSEVKLSGKATSYTGAAVEGAKVRWRVVREVRYPIWWFWRCWWLPPMPASAEEIAHGTAATAANGSFEVIFTAKPVPTASEAGEPTFNYTVHADVIDTTGETRSADRSVLVGYTTLRADLSADNWQTNDTPIEIKLHTKTLDGEGQAVQGELKIYAVRQPEKVTRQDLNDDRFPNPFIRNLKSDAALSIDPTNPNSWPLGDVVFEEVITSDATGIAKASTKLAAGMYRAKYETKDRFGKSVSAELPLQVIDPNAKQLTLKLPNLVSSPKATLEPGEEFLCVWGSGYETARAFVEIEHRGKLLQSYWTTPGTTQVAIKQKVDESMRGGFTLRVTMVRENRAYLHSQEIDVPWSNKNLTLKWEHFVSKLEPAQKETWTLVISGPDAKHAAAELVATLYDASLDSFQSHDWMYNFDNLFRHERSRLRSQFENDQKQLQIFVNTWVFDNLADSLTYRAFPAEINDGLGAPRRYLRGRFPATSRARTFGGTFGGPGGDPFGEGMAGGYGLPMATSIAPAAMVDSMMLDFDMKQGEMVGDGIGGNDGKPEVDLSQVSPRKYMNETAFFFPHLIADKDGVVKIEFTMPEALTQWKFLGFAHDRQLRAGFLSDKVITAKDLMVQPNPPRFLRDGDVIEFTAKISNQSPTNQTGYVMLNLFDARTNKAVDEQLGNVNRDFPFDIPAGESKSVSWQLTVPAELGFLTYRVVGATSKLSDGEEGYLPVLSRQILVTESLPLPIRGKQTKSFEFTKLGQSAQSDTLKHQSLTVQMVSNPSWYAVMALPYLMEFPHECSEQTFNRLYANSLARHIVGSDPKIHRVFEQWRATAALDSPLEKNQDLKAVMIEETPWLSQAETESQSRRSVSVLFDDNRLNDETARLLFKLNEMQLADGSWPWFPGGLGNDYITLYITTGFGRLRHLGVKLDSTPALRSLTRLDAWVAAQYNLTKDRDKDHLTATIALYLYGRSFFLDDQPIADEHKQAVNYWLSQAKTYWLQIGNRQSQGHLAIALKRFGELPTATSIMASLKERSVHQEELGMYWRDSQRSWWWYQAPIETQALMIEAFDEVMNDQAAVEDCKVWLLKQKQTQDWKTTKATADAIYALLLRGSDLLTSDELVDISLGGQVLKPDSIESGTGFFEQRIAGRDVDSKQAQIVVKKIDDGVAWGSVHWQYLEDMSKVTPYEGTPLTLTKQIYTKQSSKQGPQLQLVEGAVEVGDELVVRLVLKTDRDMEYVHLKDYRGSGTEPVNVISQHKIQDGLSYYESTRDTASHFFIDYLRRGTYVFEYSTRVQLRGQYQTGVASIDCMYSPEFNSHSASLLLDVK